MSALPTELLHQIFISISLQDRLTCTLVCRHWYDALNKRSLLYSVYVHHQQYHKFKKMLELLPHRATQVEKLELAFCFDPDFDKRTLINMFPNLHVLKLTEMSNGLPTKDYINKPFQLMRSTCKLESVVDIGECELTCQLVISNLCNRLKFLELEFRDSPPLIYDRVIPQLKNMPVLERLRLGECPLKIMDFEILHNNLPSIKDLQVDSPYIASSEIPRNVEPATLITNLFFDIQGADSLQSHIEFYKYLAKKYPSTNDFCCTDAELREQNSDYVFEVYDKGIFPFLQQIGTQLRGFTFESYCDEMDAFKRLDDIGCRFKELTINAYHDEELLFEELTLSNQAKSLEILELNDAVPVPANMLINMEVLRSLIIDCSFSNYVGDVKYDTELDLNQIFESCPSTLVNLSTDYTRVKCIESTSNSTPIKYLTLTHINLTPALAKTIETSLPNLLMLDLNGLITDNITISLPNHNLVRVIIGTTYEKGRRNAFSSKSINNGKLEYHASRPNKTKGMFGELQTEYRIQPVSKEEIDDPLMLNFICASVQHLSFNTSEKFDEF